MGSSENSQKNISAVIPAYNAEQYISRTIDSVLCQTYPANEIIVVDDGSTDRTAEIVKAFGDKVRYIYQENAGVSAARNTGTQAANGELIAFLDADDEWLTEYLQKQMQLFDSNPSLAWASANYDCCLCDEGKQAPANSIEKCKSLLNSDGCFDSYLSAFKESVCGWTGTMIIKKQALIEAGPFIEGLPLAEDLDMWLRIAYLYPKMGFTPEPMAVYHISIPTSAMQGEKPIQIFIDFIERHLRIAKENGCLDDFKPCGGFLVRRWIRGMLFNNRGKDIKLLLNKFPELLPTTQRAFFYTLATFPKTTAFACRTISKIVRKFNLRKKAVRPPSPRKKS
jgi:glycosyltransferase involved in cell wall biosynthesis